MAVGTSLPAQTLGSPGTAPAPAAAEVSAKQVTSAMNRVCPLITGPRGEMLWLTLDPGSWHAFVLSLLLQKSPPIFQTTLAAVWCVGTLTAEWRLLHPMLNQGVHYTGKMLFCINNLFEPSHVSLQFVSGTETCCVFPHGKNHINNKEKLGTGWHRSQISDSEAFIHSWGKLLFFFQHCEE